MRSISRNTTCNEAAAPSALRGGRLFRVRRTVGGMLGAYSKKEKTRKCVSFLARKEGFEPSRRF